MECITSWHRNGLGVPINFETKLWFVPDKWLCATQCHKPTKLRGWFKQNTFKHGDSWDRSLLGVLHWYKSTNIGYWTIDLLTKNNALMLTIPNMLGNNLLHGDALGIYDIRRRTRNGPPNAGFIFANLVPIVFGLTFFGWLIFTHQPVLYGMG